MREKRSLGLIRRHLPNRMNECGLFPCIYSTDTEPFSSFVETEPVQFGTRSKFVETEPVPKLGEGILGCRAEWSILRLEAEPDQCNFR